FGIVQGGADPELRERSAKETDQLGFDGHGIGGLAVGETAPERDAAMRATIPHLNPAKVRYVMGLGDTDGLLAAIAAGADLFDCVIPTRLARHGKALTRRGDVSLKRAEWTAVSEPIEADCPCFTCRTYSAGYLRHLLTTGEMLGPRLLTIHNLTYTHSLLAEARATIIAGGYDAFRAGRLRLRRIE
ncbi:MAG: tRNA-guanine transglycosylase, partial [Actinobacteria bacterium]